jgi:GMP synthase-like glutamine amidotransferase
MNTKKIHCFQHERFEGLGEIANWLSAENYPITYTYFFKKHSLPSMEEMDGLIIMGGAMSVNDEAKFPWLVAEKHFIREFIQTGKPVLGICLGSQLIANVLGSAIFKNPDKEIGWYPIQLKQTESTQRLFGNNTKETITVFHWHGETFELPEAAEHLCSSKACHNQAFLYEKNVLGLQFHLEATEESLFAMLEGAGNELLPGKYIQTEAEILAGKLNLKRSHELLYRILETLF